MTAREKEFVQKISKEAQKMRSAFVEINELLKEYNEIGDGEGLEVYHSVRDTIMDFVMNGARLVDTYTRKERGLLQDKVRKSIVKL